MFTLGRFLKVGQKQKTERERERNRERPKVGNNNGQLRIATPPQVAHAKPPVPKFIEAAIVLAYSPHPSLH